MQLPVELRLQNKLTFSRLRSNVEMIVDTGVVVIGGRVTPTESSLTIRASVVVLGSGLWAAVDPLDEEERSYMMGLVLVTL